MPGKSTYAQRVARQNRMTPAELEADKAKRAAKKRRQRFRHYFEREYGRVPSGPDDERDMRRMMRGHPWGCTCVDCGWDTGEEAYQPRVARVVG